MKTLAALVLTLTASTALAERSAAVRESKTFSLELEPLGLSSTGVVAGIGGAALLSRSLAVHVNARNHKSCTYEVCAEEMDEGSLTLQAFVGNSFFVEGGLTSRDTTFHSGRRIEKATTRGALVAIGNQWQWASGFTLGARWLGASTPLVVSSQEKTQAATDSGVDPHRDFDPKETVVLLPTIVLGWSW